MMQSEDRARIERLRRRLRGVAAMASLIAPALAGVAGDAQAFSASDIYRRSASSVVLIFGFSDSGEGSSATGTILSDSGLVLTNNHVITNADTGRLFPSLVVYFKPTPVSGDNRRDLTTPFLVDVLARDPDLDLALLRIKDAPSGLRPIEVADSEEVAIGESVAAIGHPGGGGLWTLTTGTISSKRRDQARDIFQTDTAINPGNSGGPLLDEYSRLVGVNTFVRRVNDQGLPLEGLNYSLRSSAVLAWVNRQDAGHIRAVPRTLVTNLPSGPPVTPPAPVEPVPRAPSPVQATDSDLLEGEPLPSPADAAVTPPSRPSPPDPKARAFEGPNGEKMYGVPNPTIALHDALDHAREGYEALIERADRSVEEMDRLLDDYDNF